MLFLNIPACIVVSGLVYMKKTYLVGPDKLYKQSLDSIVSSLLHVALISREYA